MSNDEDWVADVRRWVAGSQAPTVAALPSEEHDDAIGYEAAHPALQAAHWPDAPARALI